MINNAMFLLLDSARMEDEVDHAKGMNSEYISLYRGPSEEILSSVAPYIFTLQRERGKEFEQWYFDYGWGNAWGVIVYSYDSLKSLRKHFRRFLMVKTEDGKELYFRFYDPRVLRIFLPTCDGDQLKEFFGPVDYFICEDEDPAKANVYSLKNNKLVISILTKEQVMNFEPDVNHQKRFSFF